MSSQPTCRLCGAELVRTFVDLGMSPLCESYVPAERLDEPEVFYPLHVRLCTSCLLVQLPAYVTGEDIFSDYAYFSSYSDSWVAHARRYAEAMIDRLALTTASQVTEVASNDGYLLQHFLARGIPVLGVEPAANVAETARARGIPTKVEFLTPETGRMIADQHGRADLVAANNVFAHVPDIRGFAVGLRALVKDSGLVTLEFPHLLRLIERRQYDTIYHEHFSYLSLLTSSRALATAGLRVVDVDELGTHGGSLRVYARPEESAGEPTRARKGSSGRRGVGRTAHGCGPRGLRRRGTADQERPARLPAGRGGRGPLGRRLRRPGQGEHAAEPLRHTLGPLAVHRGPQSGEAGKVPSGHAHPDPRAAAPGRNPARLHPRAALEPPR